VGLATGGLLPGTIPQAWVVDVEPLVYGSEDAITVTVLVPVGVANETPLLQPDMALRAVNDAATASSNTIALHAPERMSLRRLTRSPTLRRPASHHSIELCAGEFGGLFTTIFNCVVPGGYGAAGVLAVNKICPGEKTQMALAGSVEATH